MRDVAARYWTGSGLLRIPLVLALATAGTVVPGPHARAQTSPAPWSMPGDAPRVMTMPLLPTSPGAPAPAGAVAPPGPPGPAAELALRPLPLAVADAGMTGETGRVDMRVWLTESQAGAVRALQVAYRAAVSVRPEGSTLTVLVNGAVAGRLRIVAPAGLATQRIDLPDGVLRAGFNRITFEAEMRHRVDCSIPATFELWTRIEPAATGLLVAGTPRGPAALEDLPALPPTPDGTVPIRVVLPGKLKPAGVDAVFQLVQALAMAMGERPLAVDFGAPAGGAAGANLVLGTAEDLAAIGVAMAALSPGRPVVLQATPERRATLAVLADGPDDLARAVSELLRSVRGRPEPAWPGAGRALAGDERVTLRDLGVPSRDFGGRVFRTEFDVTLPADLLPADYDSVVLAVDGATAAGLGSEAQLRVEVNGRHVAAAPLSRSGAQTLRGLPIHLPLGVFRPGRNHIVLAASLPMPEDAACSPAGSGTTEAPRFLLLDSTALVVPRLARALRVPELSQLAGGALPFRPGREAWLVVPAPDRDSMAAAATLAARLAQAAGGVIPFRFQATLPHADGLERLVVASQGVLDTSLSRSFGPVRWAALQKPVAAPAARGSAMPGGPPGEKATSPSTALPDWAARWPGASPQPGQPGSEVIARTLHEAGTRLGQRLDGWIADWFRRGGDTPGEAGLVVSETDLGPDGTLVLVAAASPEALRIGTTRLVQSDRWPRLDGAEARLRGDGMDIVRHAQRFSLGPGTMTPGNLRLVLAGWLSLNPASYGGGALALALVLALATGLVLRTVGRPSS